MARLDIFDICGNIGRRGIFVLYSDHGFHDYRLCHFDDWKAYGAIFGKKISHSKHVELYNHTARFCRLFRWLCDVDYTADNRTSQIFSTD